MKSKEMTDESFTLSLSVLIPLPPSFSLTLCAMAVYDELPILSSSDSIMNRLCISAAIV